MEQKLTDEQIEKATQAWKDFIAENKGAHVSDFFSNVVAAIAPHVQYQQRSEADPPTDDELIHANHVYFGPGHGVKGNVKAVIVEFCKRRADRIKALEAEVERQSEMVVRQGEKLASQREELSALKSEPRYTAEKVQTAFTAWVRQVIKEGAPLDAETATSYFMDLLVPKPTREKRIKQVIDKHFAAYVERPDNVKEISEQCAAEIAALDETPETISGYTNISGSLATVSSITTRAATLYIVPQDDGIIIEVKDDKGAVVVRVLKDGTVEGKTENFDAVTRLFWKSMAEAFPVRCGKKGGK